MIFYYLSFFFYLIGPSNRSLKEVEHFLKYIRPRRAPWLGSSMGRTKLNVRGICPRVNAPQTLMLFKGKVRWIRIQGNWVEDDRKAPSVLCRRLFII